MDVRSSWSPTLVIFGKSRLGGVLAREAIGALQRPAKVKPRDLARSHLGFVTTVSALLLHALQTKMSQAGREREKWESLSLSGAEEPEQAEAGGIKCLQRAGGPGEVWWRSSLPWPWLQPSLYMGRRPDPDPLAVVSCVSLQHPALAQREGRERERSSGLGQVPGRAPWDEILPAGAGADGQNLCLLWSSGCPGLCTSPGCWDRLSVGWEDVSGSPETSLEPPRKGSGAVHKALSAMGHGPLPGFPCRVRGLGLALAPAPLTGAAK